MVSCSLAHFGNSLDTISVRGGGDLNFLDGHLTLRAGGYYETGASHPDYAHLDFPSFNRAGVGGGLSGEIRGVAFMSIGRTPIYSTVNTKPVSIPWTGGGTIGARIRTRHGLTSSKS